MRNLLISLVSTLFLVLLALIVVPYFVSTGFLKAQVQTFVKDQTDMHLDIGGDVSLSLITGLKLSAENVALRDPANNPLFDVERIDFSLALSPLLSGKADITGITLNKPILTLSQAAAIADDVTNDGAEATKTTEAESSTAPTSPEPGHREPIDLSALSLRRLAVSDAQLVSRDANGTSTTLLSGLDASISIPDFDGPATLSGSLPYREQELEFSGALANASRAINGGSSRLDISLESPIVKARVEGELALKGETLLLANFAANAGDLKSLATWLGGAPAPVQPEAVSLQGSVIVDAREIRLPILNATLGEQSIEAAARVFTNTASGRPLIRVALDVASLDLNKLLDLKAIETPETVATSTNDEAGAAPETASEPELSALSTFDMTIDARAETLAYQNEAVRNAVLLGQLQNGNLAINLKNVNVAKGSLKASLNGSIAQKVWQGSLESHQLDITDLAELAGQASPLTGMLSTNINFAAQGLTSEDILKKGNLAGTLTLSEGEISHPALQSAIPTRESSSISELTSTVTISSLDAPVDVKGSFFWNGEVLRYASTLGLGQALAGNPIPTSLSLDASPVSLALTGQFDPTKTSLSGSKLSIHSPSSRALLAWLGQEVTTGTPDLPMQLTTQVILAPQKVGLSDLTASFGQSKGKGDVTLTLSAVPSVFGRLTFEKLDVTPFMGDGTATGRTTQAASTATKAPGNANGWDTSPIDFTGLSNFNADLQLATNSLVARDIVTGPVTITAKVENGQLNGSLDKLSLYNGQGNGAFSINSTSQPAQMTARFSMANMQMRGFLRDAIGMKSLSGTGGLDIDLNTRGASQAQIIQALDGTGSLVIRDGAIQGINIPQMLRNLRGNILQGWASSDAQSTDFSALTASFQFDNGQVTNNDLQMLSPLLRLDGSGTIDLPNKRIDYRATPKLIAKLEGQGGPVDANGVPIPIIIRGSLDDPRIYPDIPGILENPEAVLKGLEQMGGAGKAAAKGIRKIEKNVTKELQKQGDKLGIDFNKVLNPQNDNQQNNNGQQKPRSLEQQLLQGVTKGLFGN
ncbi:Uncharacterized protein involved in outer membrane biogenesis [Cohaesibacter sp. ES.047]|uniref:AsmA family protein n=1 Tax=Cohaesibacter sp. ES.047 TaxID=1798205 RepID=UPI000BB8A0BF|nr:AsmA family protein [Cohaesibacter sp. ES.047]SNY90761.1 Uncharacterized protein involved in outer membrane biogenesis [Cohaesibacter sp. ES.047]